LPVLGLNIRATLEQSLYRTNVAVIRGLKELSVQGGALVHALRNGHDCSPDDNRQSKSDCGELRPLSVRMCGEGGEIEAYRDYALTRVSSPTMLRAPRY
jgi:hypothetical protein